MPANDLAHVKRLITDVDRREFFKVVLDELRRRGLDDEDLVSIIIDDLGTAHWMKSEVTKKYHPGTISDYHSVWVEECHCSMFIKFLVVDSGDGDRVVVTSFKKDDRYA